MLPPSTFVATDTETAADAPALTPNTLRLEEELEARVAPVHSQSSPTAVQTLIGCPLLRHLVHCGRRVHVFEHEQSKP